MNTSKTTEPVATIFVGKWTVNVLLLLQERAYRHGELLSCLRRISQRMLTRTLRNLEAARLVSRNVIQSKSNVVEYSLTERGRTFIAPLNSMCSWARQHGMDVSADVRLLGTASKTIDGF